MNATPSDTDRPTLALAWVGLAAADPARALEFYVAAFGWEAVRAGDHALLRRAGRDVALVYPQTAQARAADVTPHWTPFFAVADVGAAVESAERAGGTLLREPFDVPEGRIAPLQDPAGATFSIWAPLTPGPVAASATDVWWIELATPDLGAAQAFYGAVLGWRHDESASRMRTAAGLATWLPYLRVQDLDEALRRTRAAGARQVGAAERHDLGRIAQVVDPQGAVVWLLARTARPSDLPPA
jgi:uncharacterized protein